MCLKVIWVYRRWWNNDSKRHPRVFFYNAKSANKYVMEGVGISKCYKLHYVSMHLGVRNARKLWPDVLRTVQDVGWWDPYTHKYVTEDSEQLECSTLTWKSNAGCWCGNMPGLLLMGTAPLGYDLDVAVQ